MTESVRPRVAASSCLLGEPVRYNGGHSRSRFLTDQLARHVEWVPVCPEMEIGLGTPRPTIRRLTDGRLVSADEQADHTAAMTALATRRIGGFDDLDGYVLKSRSPSCALQGLPRYASLPGDRSDGQPVDRRGRGLFAEQVREALPLLPMEEDGRLNDPGLREHFVERIFAQARVRLLFAGPWRPRDLVDFHSRHKLQILAHSTVHYRALGRIVAEAGTRPPEELAAEYRRVFAEAFAVRSRKGRHANALQHVFGPLSERLDDVRRHSLVDVIEAYRQGEVPLSVPIALLRHHAEGEEYAYLADQTYLQPFPADLNLRHNL
jgi:uncharacterized protein YbgA (DUF1722 family)/uncharacterized protein YbbK (DUF523 family)